MLAHSNLGISEAAERCKDFLKTSLDRPTPSQSSETVPTLSPDLVQLFDAKLEAMESRLTERLRALQLSQEKFFREILEKLNESNVERPLI